MLNSQKHREKEWASMYYVTRGELLIVMLGGGSKATQSADIGKAIRLADLLED